MFKIIIIVCFITFYSMLTYGQEAYTLKCEAKHLAETDVELLDFYGNENNLIQSTIIDSDGSFQFQLSRDLPIGMYRIRFHNKTFLDVVYNHEDVHLSLKPPNPGIGYYSLIESTNVLVSKENRLYYDFLQSQDRGQMKLRLLNQLKYFYQLPPSDKENRTTQSKTGIPEGGIKAASPDAAEEGSFYQRIEDEIKNISKQQFKFMDRLIDDNPHAYAAKIVRNLKNPQTDKILSEVERKEYFREHFFDNVDFDDVTLLHSNVLPAKVRAYINLFKDVRLSRELQEEAFVRAVDAVMSEAAINETVYDFVLDVVAGGFEKSESELILTYIAENYALTDSCRNEDSTLSSDRAAELKDKVERIRSLAVGNIAPEIRMKGKSGRSLNLTDIEARCTLLFFWASWCPHCTSMMPYVNEIYERYKGNGLQVVAISIDEDRSEWAKALSTGKYNWIHYTELKGWKSQSAIDYNVWATPRMYLLDREKRIVAKPITVAELEENIISLVGFKK